jgi:SulP family sulfate permease
MSSSFRLPQPQRGDLLAGLSVALVLVPQSMAYAGLAGLPPERGLWAAAIAPIAAAPFVSSRSLQTGPVAVTALLTAAALASLPEADRLPAAALLAGLVGLVRMLIGVLRWGGLAWLLSPTVLAGFMVGASWLIATSQLPAALGVDAVGASPIAQAWAAAHADGISLGAAFGAGITVLLIVFGKRFAPRVPAVLIAAAAGLIASVSGFDLGPTLGTLPAGLPDAGPWRSPLASAAELFVPATLIAVVGFAEASAIARNFAARDREVWDPSREFFSQGVANVAVAAVAGFPVGGSFSRSAVARLAGGRTAWTGVVSGVCVLLLIPGSPALSPLPRSVLAGIVIAAVVPLLDPRPLLTMTRQSPPQAAVAWTTLAATLLLAPHVLDAVLLGVFLSAGLHLWRETTMHVPVEHRDAVVTVRPQGVLWFATAQHLEYEIAAALARHPEAKRVRVDLSGLGRVDLSGALALQALVRAEAEAGVEVVIEGVPAHAERIVKRVFG